MTATPKQWKPLELIKVSAQYLAQKQITSPRLDAEVLLAEILHCSRVGLYSQFETVLTERQLADYREYIRRRANHEPVSRILGKKEFMGFSFCVTPAVLSPRPETEILVEQTLKILDPAPKKKKSDMVFAALDHKMREFLVKQSIADRGDTLPAELLPMLETEPVVAADAVLVNTLLPKVPRILDLGTGSGCVAIALAKICPRANITAVDISPEALAVARRNAEDLGVAGKITFCNGDWFAALPADAEKFNLIVANPPYIAAQDPDVDKEVRDFDPALALFAGADGLDAYRTIITEAKKYLAVNGYLLFEVGKGQAPAVRDLILASFPAAEVEYTADYAGIDRVVSAQCGVQQ